MSQMITIAIFALNRNYCCYKGHKMLLVGELLYKVSLQQEIFLLYFNKRL